MILESLLPPSLSLNRSFILKNIVPSAIAQKHMIILTKLYLEALPAQLVFGKNQNPSLTLRATYTL